MFNLPALQALADDTDPLETTLSPFSRNLILAAIELLNDKNLWIGSDEINGLTDSEIDEIDAYLSQLAVEVIS